MTWGWKLDDISSLHFTSTLHLTEQTQHSTMVHVLGLSSSTNYSLFAVPAAFGLA